MRFILSFFILFFSCMGLAQNARQLKTGDILFISSGGAQGKAIELATKSKYTHVGMVLWKITRPTYTMPLNR